MTSKNTSSKKKRLWLVGIFWFFVGSYALIFYFTPTNPYQVWLGFLLLLIGVWLHPLKNEKFFENRLSKFKMHKTRTGLSVAGLLIAIVSFGINLQQYDIENYPTPSFILLSPESVSDTSLDYELKLQAEDTTSVTVEGQGVMTQGESDSSVYQFMLSLDSPKNTFNVIAKNEHKQSETSVQITRKETPEEEEERLKKQAELEEKAAQRKAEEAAAEAYGSGENKLEAHTCARLQVESLLKSPSSAKFPFESYKEVTRYAGYNQYIIESSVESQNGFGAMIKTNYTCLVEYEDYKCLSATCEFY